ncbi:hypothetical protein ACE2AJ_12560 [Aquihabitans daechungensis]|uniref:hypothetical protein n=1 Tax=Aquihabitans daechungensis TaxID=1052257 RepID=UPI003BA211C7
MIPTMLVVGMVLGLLPRWWPHSLSVTVGLAVVVSLSFGLLVGEPAAGSALALVNATIGVGIGRALQLIVPPPDGRRHRAA